MQVNPFCTSTGISVSVIADGVKSYQTLLQELYAACDITKITKDSCIKINTKVFPCFDTADGALRFTWTEVTNSEIAFETLRFQSSARYLRGTSSTSGTSLTNYNTTVPTSGIIISLYY